MDCVELSGAALNDGIAILPRQQEIRRTLGHDLNG
jgi:hypothetical protein